MLGVARERRRASGTLDALGAAPLTDAALDVLVNRGTIKEEVDSGGRHYFRPREAAPLVLANW
jgi:hypothetical protein